MLLDAFKKPASARPAPPPPSSRAASGNRHVAPATGVGPTVLAATGLGKLVRSSPDGPVDSVLAAVILALIGFGVVMVYSSSAVEATVRFKDAEYFLKRQGVYAALAL